MTLRDITVIALILFGTAASTDAAEQTSTPQEPSAAEEGSDENSSAETDEAAEQVVPSATRLKTRDLGEAFKNFQPSEEISADNAVTFPVDI